VSECEHCGAFVTDDFARVFGDNQNRVDGCIECEGKIGIDGRDTAPTQGESA